MRINTRLDDEYADQLAFIQQQTNQAVTDVIKSAIELYYQQLLGCWIGLKKKSERKRPNRKNSVAIA